MATNRKERDMEEKPILVAGATGYVGSRLIPQLLESGYRIRAMGRSLMNLTRRPWGRHPAVELAQGDVLDLESLIRAASGCSKAFYLVHSMMARKKHFAEADRQAARHMTLAAERAGLERIIYLGGLGEVNFADLSEHLRSRHEVADILRSGPVAVTCLRAAMILGSGSASFEILRYLVEHLPIMITPRWVGTPCQPIAISNVLHYLQGCLEKDAAKNQTFDIGGPDILTYRDIIGIYAQEARLYKRILIPVPVLTPKLSAYWIQFVTPVPASIAIPLTEGLRVPVICRENRIRSIIPQRLLSCRETIGLALQRSDQLRLTNCWAGDGTRLPPEWPYYGDVDYAGGSSIERGYKIRLQASIEEVWNPIGRIGGKTGWYFADTLWRLRGVIDTWAGGIGMRRGRRCVSSFSAGNTVDFWRVVEVNAPYFLMLKAEMKFPGEAFMEFHVISLPKGRIELRVISRFFPRGLAGLVYGFALFPVHEWIFRGMIRAMAKSTGKPALTRIVSFNLTE